MKVIDMHCDTISALYLEEKLYSASKKNQIPTLRKNHLHIDLEKMVHGKYLAQNFGLFVNLSGKENPLEKCLKLVDLFYEEVERNKDLIAPALNVADIKENEKLGKISGILTIEEGGVTRGNLSHLRNFYRLGVRMLTLTWNYENEIGYPSINSKEIKAGQEEEVADVQTSNQVGLKKFGIEFIREMERLGMIIDVSHLSDNGVKDVLKYSKKPFVASHSNSRAICNHKRNLTDDLIRQMASKGCVIGINYYPPFLEEQDFQMTSQEEATKGTINSIISHIKHIINVAGTNCVGLGSDFDGIPGHGDLQDASYLPKLAQGLEDSGLSYKTIEKIFYKNVFNLYKEVLI